MQVSEIFNIASTISMELEPMTCPRKRKQPVNIEMVARHLSTLGPRTSTFAEGMSMYSTDLPVETKWPIIMMMIINYMEHIAWPLHKKKNIYIHGWALFKHFSGLFQVLVQELLKLIEL